MRGSVLDLGAGNPVEQAGKFVLVLRRIGTTKGGPWNLEFVLKKNGDFFWILLK